MKFTFGLLIAGLCLVGCSSPEATATEKSDDAALASKDAPQMPPLGPGVTPDQAAADLEQLEATYDEAKAEYEKDKSNAANRDAFVAAAVKFGHESMMSPALDTSVKYRQALRIYREVLAIEPENEVAKRESELIIDIYESMGRPVPKD
jgi:tetratricopeptide (TPR) repeat protein